MAAVNAAVLSKEEIALERMLEQIADIRDATRFWARIPQLMQRALDGRRNDDTARQLCLQRVWPNFLLDQERIAAYAQYKDVIPSLGSPEPWWMNLLRNTVDPTTDERHQRKVRRAIDNLCSAYEAAVRSPQGLGTLEREVKRTRATPDDSKSRSDARKKRKSARDRDIHQRRKGK